MRIISCISACLFLLNTGGSRLLICHSSNSDSEQVHNIQDEKNEAVDTVFNKPANVENFTPEMFGASGDGKSHKLSASYNSLESARKDFPGIRDLDITIDGAAFQKAVDMASKNKGVVIAEKNYVINYPIITRDNIIIDGRDKGVIVNDNSREKRIHHCAFFLGDHSAAAFYTSIQNSTGYKLYDVAGRVSAGQNFAELANAPDVSSFKTGQLILLVSAFKRKQAEKKILLPYHITISKIVRIEGGKLYFEFPIDEDVDSAQIAANGNYDALAEINYEGVQNVTIRNLTIDAEHLSIRSYGYKCHLDNLTMVNATRVIGVNAMAYSTITNIRGTFATRGIEIKTGSSDILVRNVTGTYKVIPGFTKAIDIISLGQYCRNITIDSFNFDIGSQTLTHALIDLHARKATISNGTMIGKSQKKPFLKFFNEPYVSDPRFGCYSNIVSNVNFYGSQFMKVVMEIGDEENANNNSYKAENDGGDDEDLPSAAIPQTANVPPTSNIVEKCLFDGGSETSVANLNQGQKNILRNCTFTKAKLKIAPVFRNTNTVTDNKE